MIINDEIYEFDGILIRWGMTFTEVVKTLKDKRKFQPYKGNPNERYKCDSVFGLNATEFEVRAPLEDRPILQLQFELSPIETNYLHKAHSPYLKKLKQKLGKPNQTNSDYKGYGNNPNYTSDKVVYSAKWVIGDIRISLSVYGGIRKKDSGETRAGLFIDWTNEILAGKPYREETIQIEQKLDEHLKSKIIIEKYNFIYEQNPFFRVDYELPDPYIAKKDNDLRLHQMALYKKDLIQTPDMLSTLLSDKEAMFYYIRNLRSWFISNKWDTVSIKPIDVESIVYCNVVPESRYGNNELGAKGLILKDAKESRELRKLVSRIETEIGINIQKVNLKN